MSVLIVGLVRDSEARIVANISRVDAACSVFRERRWLVIESDSSDRTVERLRDAVSLFENFDFRTLGALRDEIPERTRRIAHCRNLGLDALRESHGDVDFLIVADLDGINDQLSREAIESCFRRDDWAACTANQDGPYYDIYALRHPVWCPDDWWVQHRFALGLGIAEEESIRFACYSKMLRIGRDAPWIEVDSAFGGLAIYRADALRGSAARYSGTDGDGHGVCEHVPFHAQLRREGCRLFVNPALINAGYTEHTWELVGRRELKHVGRSLGRIAKARTLRALRSAGLR